MYWPFRKKRKNGDSAGNSSNQNESINEFQTQEEMQETDNWKKKHAEIEMIYVENRKYHSKIMEQLSEALYDEKLDSISKAEKMKSVLENAEPFTFPYICQPSNFMYYFDSVITIESLILSNQFEKALYLIYWSIADQTHANLTVPYVKDRYLELLQSICYNASIETKGSTTMLHGFFKFLPNKERYNPSSDAYGVSETVINSFDRNDTFELISSIVNKIINNPFLTDEQQIYMLDYASYVIAKDLQNHLSVSLFYDEHLPDINVEQWIPQYSYEMDGTEKSLEEENMIEVDLCQYPTFAVPDKIVDTVDAVRDVEKNGFIKNEKNNDVLFYKPLNICIVRTGNHHIYAGIATGSCIVKAKVIDLAPAFEFLRIQEKKGKLYWTYAILPLKEHPRKDIVIPDGRIAVLYEIARYKAAMSVRLKNKNEQKLFLKIPNFFKTPEDYLLNHIFRMPEMTVIDTDNLREFIKINMFPKEYLSGMMTLEATEFPKKCIEATLKEAKKRGWIEEMFVLTRWENGRREIHCFKTIDEIIKFKLSMTYTMASLNLNLEFVRTDKDLL